jgi:hypothetical protein
MTLLNAMQFTTSIWQQPITCYLERPALDLNDIRSQRSTDAQAPCPPGSQRHVQRRPAPRVLDRPSRSEFPYQVVHLPVRSYRCRYPKPMSVSVSVYMSQRKSWNEPLDGTQDRRRSRTERLEDLAFLRSLNELFKRDRSLRDGQPEVWGEVRQSVRVGLGISVCAEQGQDRVSLWKGKGILLQQSDRRQAT